MTFRQALILLASLGLTFGGIATYQAAARDAAYQACAAHYSNCDY